jgi:hypothetical protein
VAVVLVVEHLPKVAAIYRLLARFARVVVLVLLDRHLLARFRVNRDAKNASCCVVGLHFNPFVIKSFQYLR